VGVILGFVTTVYLMPEYLAKEQIGLLRLIVSLALLFAQFGTLGYVSSSTRIFPYFRNPDNNHNGFFSLSILVFLLGSAVSLASFYLFKPYIINNNADNAGLLIKYIHLIPWIIVFTIFYNIVDSYNKVLYDIFSGLFLKEFIQRFFFFFLLLTYIYYSFSFDVLVLYYVIAICAVGLILFWYMIAKKRIGLKNFNVKMSLSTRKAFISTSFFGLVSNFSNMAISNIDVILVNRFTNLELTGIYATTIYFGVLIRLPSRALLKISSTLIAEGWKNNDLATIASIYKKSCINQFIIGLFLFLGIWLNIDNIFTILPDGYDKGKYVIFFVGLAYLIDLMTGVNGHIIATSKYYRLQTAFVALLLVLLVISNLVLIPALGITGAAIGICISMFVFNLIRFLFIWFTFKMQPFDIRFVYTLIIGLTAFVICKFTLAQVENLYYSIALYITVFAVLFFTGVYFFKISSDINAMVTSSIKKLNDKRNK